MARWGCKRSAELLFSILELVIKEPYYYFCTRDHVYYQHKDFIRFDFHAIFRMDHLKLAKNLRAKSLEAQKKVVNKFLLSMRHWEIKVIKSYNAEPNFKSRFHDSADC
jgi:subfamily B ATP-binding cassette protein MsbA